MALADLRCELSWSASRAKEFERCRREYWYARYASWGWWTERPPADRYQAMVHKNLYSLPAFAGDCVHRALQDWFQRRENGYQMDAQELFEAARDLFRIGWRQSHGDGWKQRPNKSVHLEEHHYGVEITKANTDRFRDLLEKCANNFLNLRELQPVRQASPESWLAVESLDSYEFLGTKVYAVPDFAYQEENKVHIHDWKTGKPREEDVFQLHTYALYACEKWSVDPEDIVLHASYLATGDIRSQAVNVYQLSEVQDKMSESVREMMDLHYDPDEDDLMMDHWPASGAPHNCGRCRFRGICESAPTIR